MAENLSWYQTKINLNLLKNQQSQILWYDIFFVQKNEYFYQKNDFNRYDMQ